MFGSNRVKQEYNYVYNVIFIQQEKVSEVSTKKTLVHQSVKTSYLKYLRDKTFLSARYF